MSVKDALELFRNLRDRDFRAEGLFVVEGERAVQRPVELGWQEGDWVEIVSGLAAQDLVVTEGAALISEGSRLIITAEESIP